MKDTFLNCASWLKTHLNRRDIFFLSASEETLDGAYQHGQFFGAREDAAGAGNYFEKQIWEVEVV